MTNETEKKIQKAVVAYREGTAKRWDFCEAAEEVVGFYTNGATRQLAGRIGLSVSQVENYARAWLGWKSVNAYVDDKENLARAKELLTISHWTAFADVWKQLEFHISEGWDVIREVLDEYQENQRIPNVLEFKALLQGKFGDGGVPEWQTRWETAAKALRKAVDDYGIPEEVRKRALFLLEYDPPMKVYTIENFRAPSWNTFYSQGHWSKRDQVAREVHALVRAEIDPEDCKLGIPVDVLVVATYKKNPVDSDNVTDKLFIDPLKGWVIPEDDNACVRRTTTISRKGDTDSVTIIITECQGAKPWGED